MQISRRHLLASTGVVLGGIALAKPAFADEAFVAVTAIVEHPALDACRDGIRDELIPSSAASPSASSSGQSAPCGCCSATATMDRCCTAW